MGFGGWEQGSGSHGVLGFGLHPEQQEGAKGTGRRDTQVTPCQVEVARWKR